MSEQREMGAIRERLARWQLTHTAPAPLSIDHPVQDDIAAAADEIERLRALLDRYRGALEHVETLSLQQGSHRGGDWELLICITTTCSRALSADKG